MTDEAKNWNSVFLDGAVPDEVLRDLCDRSYQLVFQKLTKKLQREITERLPSGSLFQKKFTREI